MAYMLKPAKIGFIELKFSESCDIEKIPNHDIRCFSKNERKKEGRKGKVHPVLASRVGSGQLMAEHRATAWFCFLPW